VATWARLTTGTRDVQATQSVGEPVPSVGDGLDLAGVAGFNLWMVCDAGQSFSSADVVFEAYRYDAASGVWARAPEHDITIGSSAVGERSIAVAFTVASPRGRICHVWDGTGVTGGNVTTTYSTSLLTGERNFG